MSLSFHWVHCHVCHEEYGKVALFLTECLHIFCHGCLHNCNRFLNLQNFFLGQKQCVALGKSPPKCCVCLKEDVKKMEINSQMPNSVKKLFTSPSDLYKQKLKDVVRTYEFQLWQAKQLVTTLDRRVSFLSLIFLNLKNFNFCEFESFQGNTLELEKQELEKKIAAKDELLRKYR